MIEHRVHSATGFRDELRTLDGDGGLNALFVGGAAVLKKDACRRPDLVGLRRGAADDKCPLNPWLRDAASGCYSVFQNLEYGMPQTLLPQDVVVLLKLVADGGTRAPMARVAADLSLSSSQVHHALKRLERARLLDAASGRPVLRAVEEFLIHAVKYAFPVQRGEMTRGVATAHAAPPLNTQIVSDGEPPPVWPAAAGTVRGTTLEPLHKSAPHAATHDPALYELLALVDAIRDGRVRERRLAERNLSVRLKRHLRG